MVDVPAVGHVKKTYVIAGGALIAGIAGYAWWKASSANAAGADIPAYTEGDVAADGVTDTSGGAAGSSANSGGSNTNTSTTPDTDAEWVQQATEALSGSYDLAALSTALGRYITHVSLTTAQQDMVRAAIGIVGYPPGGQYAIMPDATPTPSALTEPKHVRLWSSPEGKTGSSFIALEWDAVSGASHYRIFRGLGENVGDSTDTKFYVRGLQPNTSYSFVVKALDASNKEGPASTKFTAKTTSVSLTKPAAPKVSSVTKSSAVLSTTALKGVRSYLWYINNVAHGHSDGPSYKVVGLRANTAYKASVKADNPTQAPGPVSGQTAFHTKK